MQLLLGQNSLPGSTWEPERMDWHLTCLASNGPSPRWWHSHRVKQGHTCQLYIQGFKSHCHGNWFQSQVSPAPVLGVRMNVSCGQLPARVVLSFWCLRTPPMCTALFWLACSGLWPNLGHPYSCSFWNAFQNEHPASPSVFRLSLFGNSCLSFKTQFSLFPSPMPSLGPT